MSVFSCGPMGSKILALAVLMMVTAVTSARAEVSETQCRQRGETAGQKAGFDQGRRVGPQLGEAPNLNTIEGVRRYLQALRDKQREMQELDECSATPQLAEQYRQGFADGHARGFREGEATNRPAPPSPHPEPPTPLTDQDQNATPPAEEPRGDAEQARPSRRPRAGGGG